MDAGSSDEVRVTESRESMTDDIDLRLVPTNVHGRILVKEAHAVARRGILVGFHGYMESAAIQMDRLIAIPGAHVWTLVAVQALNRFYVPRTNKVVAGWMTREDRDAAIADNINYVDGVLDSLPLDERTPIVYAGFSQGAAMAFRAAVRGRREASGVIAIGGDVPPELLADATGVFPRVLLARGERDEWYTQTKHDADIEALTRRGVDVQGMVYEAAHEWTADVGEAAGAFLDRVGRPRA